MRQPIPELEDYLIDHHGSVWSLKAGRNNRWSEPHLIKQWTDKRGYKHVTLRPNGDKKRFSVHVLMMITFVGERPCGATVAHLDGNPSNNHIGNLAYKSHSDNVNQRWEHKTMIFGMKSHLSKVNDEAAKDIWEAIKLGASNKEIMNRFNVSESYPSAMRAGRLRKHITGIGISIH